ncbi:MAG: glycosyltransferase family protein [Candidatus Nanopelagicales bacterium]|nr:glycosyltransferase family protein [Candidatus Nanopelagicales bacterium]
MKTTAIVQARMSSTRFPGKVLADLAGAPMIIRQLERLRRSAAIDQIVVATSTDPSDDSLVDLLIKEQIPVVRGSLDDVLERFVQVLDEYPSETVVRITGDCPLISPEVMDDVIAFFFNSKADYASNTMNPTFPDGLDVEVVRAKVLRAIHEISTDGAEREHVTLGIYRRPETFTIANFEGRDDTSELRWTVDTPEDLNFVRGVFAELYPMNPQFELAEIHEYLQRHPDRNRTVRDAKRNAALQGLDTGVMNA